MVCGGFVCTKNALCALNILYVVSMNSLLLNRWELKPRGKEENRLLKLNMYLLFLSQKCATNFTLLVQRVSELWSCRGQVLLVND